MVVAEQNPEFVQTNDELVAAYCSTAVSPVFEEYVRLSPLVGFSRSATQSLGGCLTGQHTDEILRELGRTAQEISELRERTIVT